jgi:arsenate reductase
MNKILFLCIHNSARSQMAEAYLKKLGGDNFFAESAGLEAGNLNPLAVEAMKEEGIDISKNRTNDVFEFFKEGRLYNYVITVCDEGSAASCPIFPGAHQKINWSFDDPSRFTGTYEEKLAATRQVRNKIREAVIALVKELA